MGPERSRFWLPLVRLGAFTGAVVVCGNLLFYLLRPASSAGGIEPVRQADYLGRKKRKLERHWRTLQTFFGRPAPVRSAPPAKEEPESRAPSAPAACGAPGEGTSAPSAAIRDVEPPVLAPAEEPYFPMWADPPPDPTPSSAAALPLPLLESPFSGPSMTPELALEWTRRAEPNLLLDAGDALLRGPELLLDGLFSIGSALFPRSGHYVLGVDDDEGITSRLLDFHVEERQGRLFSDFVGRLMEREQKYFARFDDSYLATPDLSDGTADVDEGELLDEQRKLLWDVLRKTYFSKYRFKADERIKDEAFYFNEWRGLDFVVLPPLMAGYLWYRGLEKRFSMGDTWLQVSFEPARRWADDEELAAGLALDWRPKGFPIGLIVSAGLYEGDPAIDFVGIGTSLGMAKKTVYLQREER